MLIEKEIYNIHHEVEIIEIKWQEYINLVQLLEFINIFLPFCSSLSKLYARVLFRTQTIRTFTRCCWEMFLCETTLTTAHASWSIAVWYRPWAKEAEVYSNHGDISLHGGYNLIMKPNLETCIWIKRRSQCQSEFYVKLFLLAAFKYLMLVCK